jgi:hypothetical protein
MKKKTFQRVIFIIAAICAFFTPILDMLPWFKFTMLLAALFYLGLGWSFTMIGDGNDYLANELVGFFYATVFFGNFMETWGMPLGRPIVYLGCILSLSLMIFMIVKRKTVRRDMLVQSIFLWLVSPVPLFV